MNTISNKVIAGILVGLVVVVGGYLVFRSNGAKENGEVAGDTTQQPAGKKMAFSDFVKQGGAYKCEVKQYLSDFENTGTVYINGENISGNYNTVAEGRKIDTSFIMRDGYSYTWSSMAPNMGFKVKVDTTNAGADGDATTQGTYSWNAKQIGDYNCEPWIVDQSKFELPKGVTFTDFSGK